MRIIKINSFAYQMSDEFVWSGKDPNVVGFLNSSTKSLLRSMGPAQGFPLDYIFHSIARQFKAEVLVDDSSQSNRSSNPNIIY